VAHEEHAQACGVFATDINRSCRDAAMVATAHVAVPA